MLAAANAQLRWTTTQIELSASLGQRKIDARFQFQNVGPRPVTIFGLKDGCGCSTSNLGQRVYAPSETGNFNLIFDTDGRPGQTLKFATLQTDDPYQPNVPLAVMVRVPEALTLEPRSVSWRIGDPPQEKTITLALANSPGVVIHSVTPSMLGSFSILGEAGDRNHVLRVKPVTTDKPVRMAIRIDVRIPPDILQTYHANAAVEP